MLYWIPYAFIRITVFFIAGILLALAFPEALSPIVASIILLALIGVYFFLYFLNRTKRRTVVNPGFIALLVVMTGGYLNVLSKYEHRQRGHLSNVASEILAFDCVIDRETEEKEKTWKAVARVSAIRDSLGWHAASGKILLYLPRNSFEAPFSYGDKLIIKGSPQSVPGPRNPGEFDYSAFLRYKNIHHQYFARGEGDALHYKNDPPSDFIHWSLALRKWAEHKLKAVVHGEREQAIAVALVLGITDGLDREMMQAYSATGAMHVLSVSGLHVGILYLVLLFMLKPLQSSRQGRWVVAGLSLFVLWGYACVTGLSPSVLRAVTMFSFMAIGRVLNRRTSTFNVIAASAFLLLLFNPFLIASVGFQLSYLAVIGIVYLQPLIYAWFEPQNRLVDEVWKVTSVSISAQLATFPLGLLYFHQFPNYFLLSNLYVLPLGFAVLAGGLAVLALGFSTTLASLAGWGLHKIIALLNYLTFLTESLPYSVTKDVNITALQCIFIMVAITAIILFLQYRRTWMLAACASSCLAMAAASWHDYLSNVVPSRLTVYRLPGRSAFDLIADGKAYFSDSGESENVAYHIAPNRILHGASEILPVDQISRTGGFGRLTVWEGKSILQLTRTSELKVSQQVKVDYLILSGEALRSLRDVPAEISAGKIIIDSGSSFRVADRLYRECREAGIPVHSVWHEGAFDIII